MSGDVCFILVGGNYCYPPGSPEAERAAESQMAFIGHATPYTTTTTTTDPDVELECFVLPAGTYCYPAGSEQAASAAEAEAALAAVVATLPPAVITPATSTTVTVPPVVSAVDVASVAAPAERVAVAAPPAAEHHVEVVGVPASLPATGADQVALGGIGVLMVVLGAGLVRLRRSAEGQS